MIQTKRSIRFLTCLFGTIILVFAVVTAEAKTRWSALHFVPDADFLSGGQFVIDAEGYYFSDTAAQAKINPVALVNMGIMEWVNLEAGYAGGPTLGFKARILGESGPFMPSLALGVHNILSNREAGLFSATDTLTNEVYLALAKSIDPLKMRIHLGVQTIPMSKKDQINPFFAIEQFFGNGLYASFEMFRRQGEFQPSVFVTWRLFKKRLEVSGGAVSINQLFFDKNNQFKVALGDSAKPGFVKPGIWVGLRYLGEFGSGKGDVFGTLEERVSYQGETIKKLSMQMDSLRMSLSDTKRKVIDVNASLARMSDSMGTDKSRMKPLLLDKINAIKTLYAEEPFDPERVRRSINEIVNLHENALPGLREILLDKALDKRTRTLTVSLLGAIGNSGASDILLDVLSQTQDPDIKIEICIALGKIKETRAQYVLEQLANDPVDAVAFAAQEVLLKLSKDTGMKLSKGLKLRSVVISDQPTVMPDSKIKTKQTTDTLKSSIAKQKMAAPEKTEQTVKDQSVNKPSRDSVKAPIKGNKIAKPDQPIKDDSATVKPKGSDTASGASENATGDVWSVDQKSDSAKIQPIKDGVKTEAKVDSGKVAKLDSVLTISKDKKQDKKGNEKNNGKKSAKVPKEKQPDDTSDNKNW